ncbi:MAG TPA: response regulator [Ktedonobacterales bacterium]|nr:response regulator [Ktedonobacterales bacterium]
MDDLITVLIIDDNLELLEVLSEGLELAGPFTVVTASDGAQGLEHCLTHHPDCLVIDVKMPALNGYQLVRVLRGDPETAEIPLILLTALAQDYERFAGLAAGTDRYLIKPVTPRELAAAIQEVLALSALERERRYAQLAEEEGANGL